MAEDIASLSRSDKREIRSRLATICVHLLTWQVQPDARSTSWRGAIAESRNKIADLIEESPSLKGNPERVFAEAYTDGRRVAAAVTGLTMPAECPWPIGEMLDHDFWP